LVNSVKTGSGKDAFRFGKVLPKGAQQKMAEEGSGALAARVLYRVCQEPPPKRHKERRKIVMGNKALSAALPLILACALYAQPRPTSTSAGGKWIRAESPDRFTDRHSVLFMLIGEPNGSWKPSILAVDCSLKVMSYLVDGQFAIDTDAHHQGPNWSRVVVRTDKDPPFVTWWRYNLPDEKTIRTVFTAKESLLIRVHVFPDTYYEDEFRVSGLDLAQVRSACGDKFFKKYKIARR
jgi:hypothetical protein